MSEPTDEEPEAIKDKLEQAAKEETVSHPARRYRTIIFQGALLSTVIVFAFLAFLVKTIPSFQIDLQITQTIQSIDSPLFTRLMMAISWAGFSPNSMIVTVILAGVLYLYGLHWESIMTLVASLSSGATNQLIKNFIQRPRPAVDIVHVFSILDSYSFPSGHVMFYTIVFGFIWYLAYTLLKHSWKRTILLGFFGSLILLVGVSRIYLGQHWASDVLGAYLLGGLMLVGMVLLYQWGKKRFFVHQPVAAPDPKKE
jgi:undecaprenyl-diphosphatase